MTKTKLIAGALSGLIVAGSLGGVVSAQSASEATGLSEEDIVAIALAEVPGTVEETELETEDGLAVWEVEILTPEGVETELEIAAMTGEILEIEVEDDNHCDDEDDEDDKDDA